MSKYARPILYILILIAPVVMTLLLAALGGIRWSAYLPAYSGPLNDGLFYWLQARTFATAGMTGGYFTIGEMAAPLTWSHFYFYGPLPIAIYGVGARLLQQSLLSLVIVNHLLVMGSLAVVLWVMRPATRQAAILLIVVATFLPLLFTLPLSMQEGLQFALTLLVGSALYRLWLVPSRPLSALALLTFVLIAVGAHLRLLSSFYFLPYFLLLVGRRWWLAIVLSLLCAILSLWLFTAASSPFPMGVLTELSLTSDWVQRLRLLTINAVTNLFHLFLGDSLMLVVRLQVVMMIGLALVAWSRHWRRWRWLIESQLTQFQAIMVGLNVAAAGAVLVILYGVGSYRDIRQIAPHLLLSLVLLVMWRRERWVLLIIALQIPALPGFLNSYRDMADLHRFDATVIAQFRDQTQNLITYDPTADNAWCNTLLFQMVNNSIPPALVGLPPEIGVSFFIDPGLLTGRVRSQYVLLPAATTPPSASWVLLAATVSGDLYRNDSSGCQPDSDA